MAVVTKYGTGYPDPTSKVEIDADLAEAKVKTITSVLSITNGDSINSKFYVGRVPSNAILDPRSIMYYEAVAGVTSLDIGFVGAVNALVAAKDVSTAGSAGMMTAVATASLGTRAWQMAGLASDPGGFIDIFATLNQAATATKKIACFFDYLRKM